MAGERQMHHRLTKRVFTGTEGMEKGGMGGGRLASGDRTVGTEGERG